MWKGRIIALDKVLNLPTRTLLQLYTYMYVFSPRDHAAAICLFPFCSLSPQKFLRGKKTKEDAVFGRLHTYVCWMSGRRKGKTKRESLIVQVMQVSTEVRRQEESRGQKPPNKNLKIRR